MRERLYRVEWDHGLGWPTKRESFRRVRVSRDEETVKRIVAEIEAVPSHHRLVGRWHGTIEWEEEVSS
jgi:hypothetical protein